MVQRGGSHQVQGPSYTVNIFLAKLLWYGLYCGKQCQEGGSSQWTCEFSWKICYTAVLLKSIIGKNAAETSVINGPNQQDHVKKNIYRILEKFQPTAVRSWSAQDHNTQ